MKNKRQRIRSKPLNELKRRNRRQFYESIAERRELRAERRGAVAVETALLAPLWAIVIVGMCNILVCDFALNEANNGTNYASAWYMQYTTSHGTPPSHSALLSAVQVKYPSATIDTSGNLVVSINTNATAPFPSSVFSSFPIP